MHRMAKWFAAAACLAMLVGVWSAVRPEQAGAQGNAYPPNPCAFGPVLLDPGEGVQVSLLLPAVQRLRSQPTLVVVGQDGSRLASLTLPAVQGLAQTRTVDIALNRDGVLVLQSDVAGQGPQRLGANQRFTVLLLPAVQQNLVPVPPVAASAQILGEAGRKVFVQMCDGSV